jgi:hypothetical protein
METSIRRLLALFAFTLAGPALFSGYVFEMEMTENGAKTESVSLAVQDGDLRFTLPPSEETPKGGELIFLAKGRELLIVDHAKRSFIKIDAGLIEGFKAQMAMIPEAQRAAMMQMMGGGSFKLPELTVEDLGETRKIGEYKARRKRVLVDGKPRSDLWLADFEAVEGSREFTAATKAMAEFFIGFLEAMPMAAAGAGDDVVMLKQFEKLDGFPVESVETDADGTETHSKLVAVREQDLGKLGPPAGYRQQQMM